MQLYRSKSPKSKKLKKRLKKVLTRERVGGILSLAAKRAGEKNSLKEKGKRKRSKQ